MYRPIMKQQASGDINMNRICCKEMGGGAVAATLVLLLSWVQLACAQEVMPGEEGATRAIARGIPIPEPAPDRRRGEGPFDQLVIRNVMLINGEGAPPRGPLDILIEGDRIQRIGAVDDLSGAEVIDASGMYAMPGFIDSHVHIGNTGQGLTGPITPPEYVFKLWLAHGITTVREVGSGMGLIIMNMPNNYLPVFSK